MLGIGFATFKGRRDTISRMDLVPLLSESLVQGLVLGFVFGVVVKMASKAVTAFLVAFFVFLKWLETRNIVIVDWHRLTYGVLGSEEFAVNQATALVESLIELGAFGAALAAGFLLSRRVVK